VAAKTKSNNSGCAGAIGLVLIIGLLGKACDSSEAPISASLIAHQARLAHPVRITGNGVSLRLSPTAAATSLAKLSAPDSVDYVGRENDQWSRVELRHGTRGFVSNKFLDGVVYVPPTPTPKHRPRQTHRAHAPVALAYYCASGNTVKYHSSPDCRGLSRCGASIESLPLNQAERSMDPCKFCH
jgi:hypothetical protein